MEIFLSMMGIYLNHKVKDRIKRGMRSVFCILLVIVPQILHGQVRDFSPWLVIKGERELMSYVNPIINSGAGDHVSLFVKPGKFNPTEWNAFIDSTHQGGIGTIYMSVTGSEKSFEDRKAMELTVNNWIGRAKKYRFDGIDMDIENLAPKVKEAHSAFIQYASERVHEAGLKLAMAVGFYPPMTIDPVQWWYDPVIIGEYCDHVRIMLYGQYTGSRSIGLDRPDLSGIGPTSSYPYAKESLEFWIDKVPRDKLTVNLPAFSTVFYLEPEFHEGVQDEYTRKVGKSYFPSPQDIDRTKANQRYWSWVERVWVYSYTSTLDGRLRLFYASDEDSTKHLLELLASKGIESVGMWIFTGDQIPEWEGVNQLALDWCKR